MQKTSLKNKGGVIILPVVWKMGKLRQCKMAAKSTKNSSRKEAAKLERELEKLHRKRAVQEKELENCRALFATLPEMIIVLDPKGKVLDVNKNVYKFTGYSKKEVAGKYIFRFPFIPLKSKKILLKKFAARVLGKKVEPYTLTIKDKKGKQYEMKIVASTIRDKQGRLVKDLVVASDITEEQRTTNKLKDSKIYLDTMGDALVVINGRDKRIVAVNKAFTKLGGYSEKETIGKNIFKIFPKREKAKHKKEMRNAARTGKAAKFDAIALTKSGKEIPVSISGTAVLDSKGRPTNFVWVFRDISEKLEAEEMLRESEEKYRHLVENAGEPIFSVKVDGTFISMNKTAANELGGKPSDFIGKTMGDLFPKKIADGQMRTITHAISKGEGIDSESKSVVRGKERWYSAHIEPIKNREGKINFAQLIVHDITPLKKVEEEMAKAFVELKKLDKLKADFMNIAAHELKTPITPIRGYVEIMLNKELPREKETQFLSIVHRNTLRLELLINDVLDISRLESRAMRFDMQNLDIVKIIKTVEQDMKAAANEKKIKIGHKIKGKLPIVKGDKRRISQVLGNLVKNAVKFTKKGGITINAFTKNGNVVVEVKDTGIGISDENIPKLFTKFFQAQTSETREAGGTGLGLAICKGIIEEHGGEVGVKSRQGKGSTFYFSLPRK